MAREGIFSRPLQVAEIKGKLPFRIKVTDFFIND